MAQHTRADALSFSDNLITKKLVGSTVSRVISSIRAVFNFAISEYALNLKSPFIGMYFDKSGGVSKRLPIPIEDISKLQHLCRTIDDYFRWLVTLVSDTVMRLAEATGLLKTDKLLDADISQISFKPHPWWPLKTSGSQRNIALGAPICAAQRLSGAFPSSPFAFPRYNTKDATNSNSASAASNKLFELFCHR